MQNNNNSKPHDSNYRKPLGSKDRSNFTLEALVYPIQSIKDQVLIYGKDFMECLLKTEDLDVVIQAFDNKIKRVISTIKKFRKKVRFTIARSQNKVMKSKKPRKGKTVGSTGKGRKTGGRSAIK